MLTNVVRNFRCCRYRWNKSDGAFWPTGQQDDTTMGDYDDYEDQTYTAPAPAAAPLAPAQPSRHRDRDTRDRDRDREREEPRRSDKHRRR